MFFDFFNCFLNFFFNSWVLIIKLKNGVKCCCLFNYEFFDIVCLSEFVYLEVNLNLGVFRMNCIDRNLFILDI